MSLALIVSTLMAGVLSAQAADLDEYPEEANHRMYQPPEAKWEAAIVPLYGWITGYRGDVGVFGVEASINITPIEVLQNLNDLLETLDGIYMGSGHVRYNRIGFLYDISHIKVASAQEFAGEGSRTVDTSLPGFGPISGPDLSLTVGARVDGIVDVAFSHTMTTLAGTYRAYESRTSNLDLIAGVRITDVDLKIGVVAEAAVAAQATLTLGPISKTVGATAGTQVNASANDGDTWVDPIIGVRGDSRLDKNWFVTGWAMIGGFGASSDLLYDLMGGVGYEWENGLSAFGGYRLADTDYQSGDFKWDLAVHGPIVGLGMKF